MRYDTNHSITGAANTIFSVFVFSVLCFLLLAAPVFCPGCDRDVSPPDVSSCTRLEIRYPRSTLNYFLPVTDVQRSVLNADERKKIQAIEFFTVNDTERINAFARNVSLGTYGGRLWGGWIMEARPVVVDCYRDNKRMFSFTVLTDRIVTEEKRIFNYPKDSLNLEIIEPTEMRPFKLRYQCGLNLQRLCGAGPLYHKEVNSYPEPNEWCDAVIRDRTNTSYVSEEKMRGWFKCPAVGEGECHYALNPLCEPNSLLDTVLLFETKTGWNQHGGAELFTFDNHEPRGGCVLLNDGTVKFVRTKEELQQLRWK